MYYHVDLLDQLCLAFFQWNSIASLEDKLLAYITSISEEEIESFQQDVVDRTFQSDLYKTFPPEPESQTRFFKRFIRVLEDKNHQVLDCIYDKVGLLHAHNPDVEEEIFYRSYFFQQICVSLKESKQIISSGTTGLCTWTAGTALARWIGERDEGFFANKSLIELGSGSGISGIYALKKWTQIEKYVFSDCHGKVLENLKHNVRKNLSGERCRFEFIDDLEHTGDTNSGKLVKVIDLNWEEVDEDFDENIDIVLGADIVFDKSLLPYLVNTIRIMLRKPSSRAYIACTVRNGETYKSFQNELDKSPLNWSAKPLSTVDNPIVELVEIYI